ncbi:hypothetical protein P5673_031460 [Acropora cervicornis]|uniref:Uncharacterized protein n=1 Tax=Acropora cervicornis TaxID=6130 RepID=A0AAD9PSQ5_ACRCE|nr:hypothetical protein P5673_031460 [Acropora cervicornis]
MRTLVFVVITSYQGNQQICTIPKMPIGLLV